MLNPKFALASTVLSQPHTHQIVTLMQRITKKCKQILGLPRSPAILKRLRGLDPGNSLNSSG